MKKMKTYYIFTLGCQMNENDSERIAAVLDSCGLKPADEKKADLIIVNACSVRQKPIDRIWGKIKVWKERKNPPKIYLTGCVLDSDRRKLEKRVDEIFEIDDLASLPKLLNLTSPITKHLSPNIYFAVQPARQNTKSAFVPIMTGCNNFCSYCVVPYTRGREHSRPAEEILCEIKKAIKQGYSKITLLGQNVNSYQSNSDNFVDLLKKIIALPADFEIDFLSPHPKDFSSDLIVLIARSDKLSKQIHFPVQSGDDQILRKMNRGYTASQYLKLISKLRSHISNLTLSTDIIVGFPGETKKAFQTTVNLVKKAKFNKAYIAMYSPRPGTAAYRLKDDVPRDEKKRRWKILEKLINQ